MRRPLLALGAAFAAGCLAADARGGAAEIVLLSVLAGALLTLAPPAPPRWGMVALGAAGLGLGTAAAHVEALAFESGALRREVRFGGWDGTPVCLTGVVRGDASPHDGRLHLALDVSEAWALGRQVSLRGRVRVEVGGETPLPALLDGERVTLWARLRPTVWLDGRRDGAVARGYCKSARLITRQGDGVGGLRRTTARFRALLRSRLQSALPPGPERGLVLAMVLGDRSEIDEETADSFRASGTYHVLALSGAQVALVAGLVAGGLRWLRAAPVLEALLTSAIVWFYAGLVGGDVPIVRAALMASVLLAGRAVDLSGSAANLLGLAALALLLVRPAHVWDVGFQLSFGATLGILILVGPITRGVPVLPFRVDLAVAASVAAQAVLSPVLAAQFHRLAPAALVLNLAAVPLSAAVLLAGLAALAVAPTLPVVGDLAWIAAFALRRAGDLGPLAPWLDLRVAGPSLAVLCVHVAGLAHLARGRRGRGLALVLASHVGLAVGPGPGRGDGRLHLHVLDVGQGDSLLLRSPSGRALLVDAGGSWDDRYDVGERRVAPALWAAGAGRVDALALTHGHPDHVGGAGFLLHAFRVNEIWEGPAALADPAWRRLDRVLAAARVRRRTLARGHRIEWDGVELVVLGPAPRRPPLRIRNEDSLVLAARRGSVTFLLAGDVEGAAEEALDLPPSLVVKVPHHGSRSGSSPSFVGRTGPRVAVVSVGARNPFGHPHRSVMRRYADVGALVLRTDRDGTVTVATDGARIWVRTASEPFERRIR